MFDEKFWREVIDLLSRIEADPDLTETQRWYVQEALREARVALKERKEDLGHRHGWRVFALFIQGDFFKKQREGKDGR